jgi:hypothetical protein
LLPLLPFPLLPLSPLPLPLLPLPVAPLSLLPLPELPLDVLTVGAVVVATVVVALDDVDVALDVDALLLTTTAVTAELLEAVVVVLVELSLHTVAVPVLGFAALRTRPGATAPWARPFVTLWKFSFTSPSELEMRTTPPLGV